MNLHFRWISVLALALLASSCVRGVQLKEHREQLVTELDELLEPALRCDYEYEIAQAQANTEFALYSMLHGRYMQTRRHITEASDNFQYLRAELDLRPECWSDYVEVPPAPPCSAENLEVDCNHPNCSEHPQCGPCTVFNPEVDCDHPNCQDNHGCAACGQYTDWVDCAEPSCMDDERCAPCTEYSGVIDCEHPNCSDRLECEPCTEFNPDIDCDHPNCADEPSCVQVVVEDTLVVVTDDRIEINEQINFETASATIAGARSFEILDHVADALLSRESMTVRVEGHTDNVGRAAYNRTLSQSRAESVRNYLLSRGIDGSRMEAVGFGPDRPIDDNSTESGRAANRRVEFHILSH